MADGILLVDKPTGCTSADVVRSVKRRHRPRSLGHLGTLDPMATGVLPLCVDGGTRLAQFLAAESKAYTGSIQLGRETDTLDATGATVGEAAVPSLTAATLEGASKAFLGEGLQVPPMYSAVKKDGRRLYELAREGREVAREARRIRIDRLRLRAGPTPAEVEFEVACSKGTYVRVLAADLGRHLGTVACLGRLRRTEFGPFLESECVSLDGILARAPGDLPVLAPRDALRGACELMVDGPTAFGIAAGQQHALARLEPPAPRAVLGAVIAPNGGLLAVVEPRAGAWHLRRVVMPEASELYRP